MLECNFYESNNENHYFYQDKGFINHVTNGSRGSTITKQTSNLPAEESEFNSDQLTGYIAQHAPEGAGYMIQYVSRVYNVNGVLYTVPICFSVIISDPTGRLQKIKSLDAIFGEQIWSVTFGFPLT